MDYLKLHLDWDEITRELSYKERGRLLEGLLFYVKNRTEPDLSGNERFYFNLFKRRIDEDIQRFDRAHKQNKLNGAKGGRPRRNSDTAYSGANNPSVSEKTENNPSVSKEKGGEKENEKKKERTKEKRKEKEREPEKEIQSGAGRADVRMKPPTVEEVSLYCLERQNNVDAEAFVAYYTSNGWRVGKNPMRDWRAAVRTWEKNGIGAGASKKGDVKNGNGEFKALNGFKLGCV